MSKSPFFVLAGVLLSCSPASPRFAITAAERRGVIESNGVRFVIMPDATTKLAEVDIRYDVGSREDPQGKAGLAHLVEHLMFQVRPDGPETAPIFQTIIDLTTGFNAFTEWDRTHYFMTSQAPNLESMLKIEAMRMFFAADQPAVAGQAAFGCSTLPTPEFEREREVVRNEIRNQSSADDYIVQLVEAAVYPKGHAYERLIGGNDQQIASASLHDACEFMTKYYAPERATILVAGAVDVDQTVEMIKKWFGRIPKRAPAPRIEVKAFVPDHARKEIEADVERPAVWIGFALPAGNTPEGEAAQLGLGGLYGRLSYRVRKFDIGYGVQATVLGGRLAPLFLVRIELKSLDKVDEAIEAAKSAAAQAHRGFDMAGSAELEEDKNREKARFIESLEQLQSRTIQVADLIQFTRDMDFNSTDMYTFHQLDKIEKFDEAHVGAAVKNALDWDKAAIIVVKPNAAALKGDVRAKVKFAPNSDAAMTDPAIDPREAKRPVKLATQNDALTAAKRFTLDNGMEVVLMPVDTMPLARATLIFKNAGQAATPDSPAVSALASDYLSRVDDMDPQMQRNTDVFSRTGIEPQCRSNDDATYCSAHGVNIYLDVMIRGVERIVAAGVYSQERIEQWQKINRDAWKLKSVQAENEYIRQVMTALYGPDHPYTRSAIATPDAVGKAHKDALDSFRHGHFTAGNASLIVVGKFDMKYAESIVRSTFGGWGKSAPDKAVDPTPFKRTGAVYVGVKQPKEDQQVIVAIAYPAPAGIDGQEGAREVLTRMISERAANIRFKLGSTYGLRFARSPHKGPSAYILHSGGREIGGTIDAERAGESIKALRDSIDALRNGDHFDEDFARARRKLLSELLTESTVTGELAARLARISVFGLSPNYYNTLLQQVAAVSPAQVRALLAHELDPSNEIVAVLGDKAHLDRAFADAGIKDVKIVEPDYK